jgi:branched-chain amino acid aminotransferase
MVTHKEINGDYYIQNDSILPAKDFDDSFLKRGVNVYEVMRVIDHAPLFLEDHCERFSHSLKGKKIAFFCNLEILRKKLRLLIDKNGQHYGNIKMVYHFENDENCFLIIYPVKHNYPGEEDFITGVKALFMSEERPDPAFKNWRPYFKERVKKLKESEGVFEVILVNQDGVITEGSQSNLFFIHENKIITARKERILAGITRKYVYRICEENNIKIIEKDIKKEEIAEYQSAFISGTSPKILPLSNINSYKFNPEHSLLRMIIKEYERVIKDYIS